MTEATSRPQKTAPPVVVRCSGVRRTSPAVSHNYHLVSFNYKDLLHPLSALTRCLYYDASKQNFIWIQKLVHTELVHIETLAMYFLNVSGFITLLGII